MTHTTINGKTIVLSDTRPANVVRKLAAGRAWQVADAAGLNPTDRIDLAAVASKLQNLKAQVSAQFVDRDELASAILVALAAGEHCFVYGPPGTAKTKLIEALTDGLGGVFGERQITAETTSDEVFGPIDAIEFSNGRYTRRWAGIATAHVFYINEVWEASSTVTNIFKTALESRKVHDGDIERSIPLLSAIADSNHVPTGKDQQADWDRFLIRLEVGWLKDADLFEQMLTSEAGAIGTGSNVNPDDIRLLAAASELLALEPPRDLVEAMKNLWREIGQNGRSVSDRRWRKTLKAACAAALLEGAAPQPRHLAVARWTLWNDLDERQDVSNLVLSLTDPFASAILDLEALLADLKQAKGQVDRSDAVARQEVISRGRKLQKEAEALVTDPSANGYQARLDAVAQQAAAIWEEVLDW